MPTVVLATDEFAALAREAAESQGLASARIQVVAHPIGGIPERALDERADAVVDAVMADFCGG